MIEKCLHIHQSIFRIPSNITATNCVILQNCFIKLIRGIVILLNITDQKSWQTNVTFTNIIIIFINSELQNNVSKITIISTFYSFRSGRRRSLLLEPRMDISADPESAKLYGVKGQSALNRSKFFHVVTGLLSDIMHDILEGVLPLHMKTMLHRFVIENKYFSLDELNSRLLHFPFGFTDSKNRPSIVKSLNLADRHMNQPGTITQSYCDVQ